MKINDVPVRELYDTDQVQNVPERVDDDVDEAHKGWWRIGMARKSDKRTDSDRLKEAVEKLRAARHQAEPNVAMEQVARKLVVIGGKSPSKQVIHYPKASSALRQYSVEARKEIVAPTTRLRVGTATGPSATAKVTTARARELTPATSLVQAPASTPVAASTAMPGAAPGTVPGTALTAIASVADLGSLVRRQRRLREMSQDELATRAGTGRRFVSDLEGGKPTIEFGRLLAVCAVLGIVLAADGGER